MSHIFCLLNNSLTFNNSFINENLPKNNYQTKIGIECLINVSEKQQIIVIDNIILICDGDIYNYKELFNLINFEPQTTHSYEIIIYLFILYGIEQTLNLIDGIFAFILYDSRSNSQKVNSDIYIARDVYGVKNFLLLKPINDLCKEQLYGFSSNIETIVPWSNENYVIETIKSGSYRVFNLPMTVSSQWKPISNEFYYNFPSLRLNNSLKMYNSTSLNYELISLFIKSLDLKKRYKNNGFKIAYLLTNNTASFFMASFLKRNLSNIISIYTIENKNNKQFINDKQQINIFCKKHHIMAHNIKLNLDIFEYNNNNNLYLFGDLLKNKYKFLISEIGMAELFGLNLSPTLFNDDIFEYDKNIRENIKNISQSPNFITTKNIGEINNINILYPFLDKDFINFYMYNHSLIKKRNIGILPPNFELYL